VDFAALDNNADSGIDDIEPVTESVEPTTPVEPVTFERTPATENATALLARVRQQARQAIAAGNWQEANEAIRTGTAVAPDDPELALLHVESEALRDPSVAEQTATAVLNELPQAWPVRQWLGLRWLQMQQAKRAYGVLTTLAPPISTAPDYHNVLALAAQQSGEHAAAVTIYQQLISLQPAQGRHQAGLAISLEALGNSSGARSAWQQALRDPQLPLALVRYGQSRLQQLPSTTSSAQASP
jgi:MSHA biogenesis protein MshN